MLSKHTFILKDSEKSSFGTVKIKCKLSIVKSFFILIINTIHILITQSNNYLQFSNINIYNNLINVSSC